MEALKQLFRKETCLPSLGPCMIVFAIPLLLPGLTLTLVALWDETGYSKFSALHVVGIILLVCSGLLLLLGLLLNFTVTKKAKGRVSPQEEEEDSTSRCSSSQGSEIMGHVLSTHGTRAAQDPASTRDSKEPARRDSEPASSRSTGTGEGTQPSLPSLKPASASPEKDPINGQIPALTTVSAASRVLQEARGERDSPDTGEKRLRLGQDHAEERRGSCNYMLTDSEDEQLEALRYTALTAELMRKSDGKMRTMSTLSSSSSLSEEHSSGEASDAEHDLHLLDNRRQTSGRPEPDHPAAGFDYRTVMFSKEMTSHSSLGQSAARSSSIEDQPSDGVSFGQEQMQSPDVEGTGNGRISLFVTRQKAAEQRPREHAADSDTENLPEAQPVTRQAAALLENSSSSVFTESPSHGTYSLKSFVSEEPVVKTSPDELSATKDDVFRSSSGILAGSPAERPRSVSPVPLRKIPTSGWNDGTDGSIIMLGSRSGGSSQSSPEKRLRTGSLPDQKSEDDSNRTKERKKKRKKKKKRRERLKAEDNDLGEVREAVKDLQGARGQGATPEHHPSLLRSTRGLQHHPEHHVHWPDDDDVTVARLETEDLYQHL